MDLLSGHISKPFFLSIIILLCSSCAKLSYLLEQGRGQIALLNKSIPNEVALKKVTIPKSHRDKIALVMEYKKYFYDYWDRKPSGIYSSTTILDSEAVTYLVIASPFDKIQAHQECFAFMGCFPYLGFFNKNSAKKYGQKMQMQDYDVWIRPVYAYSTLGHLEDTILSSFFHYNDEELAELVFHELFHTIFFIKNEVKLNENLAEYFAKQMTREYFQKSSDEIGKIKQKQANLAKYRSLIVRMSKTLSKTYENTKGPKEEFRAARREFFEQTFLPELKKLCSQQKLSEKTCNPRPEEWNNARFSAFLTYADKDDAIQLLRQRVKGDLKAFFHYISQSYLEYSKDSQSKSFEDYLFQ